MNYNSGKLNTKFNKQMVKNSRQITSKFDKQAVSYTKQARKQKQQSIAQIKQKEQLPTMNERGSYHSIEMPPSKSKWNPSMSLYNKLERKRVNQSIDSSPKLKNFQVIQSTVNQQNTHFKYNSMVFNESSPNQNMRNGVTQINNMYSIENFNNYNLKIQNQAKQNEERSTFERKNRQSYKNYSNKHRQSIDNFSPKPLQRPQNHNDQSNSPKNNQQFNTRKITLEPIKGTLYMPQMKNITMVASPKEQQNYKSQMDRFNQRKISKKFMNEFQTHDSLRKSTKLPLLHSQESIEPNNEYQKGEKKTKILQQSFKLPIENYSRDVNQSLPGSQMKSSFSSISKGIQSAVEEVKAEQNKFIIVSVIYQKFPMSAQDCIVHLSKYLHTYEKGELLDYKTVYYFNILERKLPGGMELPLGQFNGGHDNENGDFLYELHDHLGYRFEIIKKLGKGSFGIVSQLNKVLKCFDHKRKEFVALKILRNKKRLQKQGLVEVNLLNHLKTNDPEDKKNIVKMKEYFPFRQHLVSNVISVYVLNYQVQIYTNSSETITSKEFPLVQLEDLQYKSQYHCYIQKKMKQSIET